MNIYAYVKRHVTNQVFYYQGPSWKVGQCSCLGLYDPHGWAGSQQTPPEQMQAVYLAPVTEASTCRGCTNVSASVLLCIYCVHVKYHMDLQIWLYRSTYFFSSETSIFAPNLICLKGPFCLRVTLVIEKEKSKTHSQKPTNKIESKATS